MAAAAASPLVGRATRGREGGASRVVNTEHASSKYYRQVLELVLSRNRWHEERGRPSRAASVIWWDEPIRRPHFLALPPQAQVNRFYAMVRICRKVCLARLLDLARRLYPSKYLRLAPETWWVGQKSWAAQLRAHRHHCEIRDRDECNSSDLTIESYDANASAVGTRAPSIAVAAETGECANIDAFIIKPDNGCQGTGIKLVRSHSELCAFLKSKEAPARAVVQTYLANPMLIDGFKFDLRLYVIITSAAPLRAYLSRRGVARFASRQWSPVSAANQHDARMHLSNSSINQRVDGGASNKKAIERLLPDLEARGIDAEFVWCRVRRLIALTVASIAPTIAHAYTTVFDCSDGTSCNSLSANLWTGTANAMQVGAAAPRRSFQIIGMDVMLDSTGTPLLVEMNHSPSMAIAGADEDEVETKASVVSAALRLATAPGEHPASLVADCQCEALHTVMPPVDALDGARLLFERFATNRSAQQWVMSQAAFERLLGEQGAGMDAQEVRAAFTAARLETEDFGHGWDPPPVGSITFFGFVEALLRLAPRVPGDETKISVNEVAGIGENEDGMASAVKRLISRASRASASAVSMRSTPRKQCDTIRNPANSRAAAAMALPSRDLAARSTTSKTPRGRR